MQKLFDEEMHAALQQLMDETIEALQMAKVSPDVDDLGATFAVALLKLGLDVHLESILAVAQSFLITPVALNGQRKTDKLEARALCLRLSRWLDVNRDELAPFASPPKPNNPFAKPSAAANSSRAESADLLTVDWPGRRGLPRRTSRPLAGRAQLEETFPLHLKKQFPINILLS